MTTKPNRAEINRANSARSTGPRSQAGKARSRLNAVKHGCRARLPILPGEDPAVYQHRLDAWTDKFDPRDDVELYLVERAVHVSWQLDRADRAEAARLAEPADPAAAQQARDVAELGAALLRVPGSSLRHYPVQVGSAGVDYSEPSEPAHPGHPARLVAALEATALGCTWLLEQWTALGTILDEGRTWRPADRLRAVRLLGKQPFDAILDESAMSMYLACQVMDPEGPDVFQEVVCDLWLPEFVARCQALLDRTAETRAERAHPDAAAGRTALRVIVAEAVARLDGLRDVRAAAAKAAGTAMPSAPAGFDASQSGEWLRRHQATCSRTLFRTFEALHKVRRDFGDGPPLDEEPAGPPAPGPSEMTPGPDAHATARADVAPACSLHEVVEPAHMPPITSERVAIEPADEPGPQNATNEASGPRVAEPTIAEADVDARNVTNEASNPIAAGRPVAEADVDAQNVTNEASVPIAAGPPADDADRNVTNEATATSERADRPVPALPLTALVLFVLLVVAGLTAALAAIGKTPAGGRVMRPIPARARADTVPRPVVFAEKSRKGDVQKILHVILDSGLLCAVRSAYCRSRDEEGSIMPRFTPGELKVMRLLWEHGELKPGELQERFPEPIKNPALRSYLTTLLDKGHVARRLVGKAYYYKAATPPRSAFRTMLGELVDTYCGGSVKDLVMNLIKSERLSEEELLELKRLAEGSEPGSPSKKRSRT